MKKLFLNKSISIVVVLAILTSIFCINIYASESDQPYLNTYAANYFHKLGSKIGNNVEGTCGFVAAAMLLSFYDSYWNDGFVQENYEVLGEVNTNSYIVSSSPGIKSEANWRYGSGFSDYNDFIDDKADEFLHLKLLQIGRDDLGLCNPTMKEWIDYIFAQDPLETDWLINLHDIADLIEEYISQLPGENNPIKNNVDVNVSFVLNSDLELNYDYLFNQEEYNETIRNEMIEKIELGIPVIYFGYSESTNEGHFMVAYDYDSSTDTIYFHNGWIDNDTIMNDKETDFVYNKNPGILWIDINQSSLSHQHALNYATTNTATTGSLCACQVCRYHTSHRQNHVNYQRTIESTGHVYRCYCGAVYSSEPHSFVDVNINDENIHKLQCTGCTCFDEEAHQFQVGESISSTQHSTVCSCGYVGEDENHYTHSYAKNTASNHYVLCECGYYMGTDPHVLPAGTATIKFCIHCGQKVTNNSGIGVMPNPQNVPSIRYITDAGSYVDAVGNIYLVDSDMELYLACELDIDALIDALNNVVTQ